MTHFTELAHTVSLTAAALSAMALATLLSGLAALGLHAFLRQRARTRRAEAKARLGEHETRIAHASRVNALGEMASGIAHELNQPLTALLSQSQAGLRLLEQAAPDPTAIRQVLEGNVRQSKRAGQILSRFRNWSRPDSGAQAAVDLNAVARGIEELLRADHRRRGIRVTLDLAAPAPLVAGDPVQVEQLLFNLVRNAADAIDASARPGREIRIATARRDGAAVLAVTDSGDGVAAEMLPHLFEPFHTTKPDGMGLGLVLCENITHRLGGDIQLDNLPDGGVKAVVTLPAAEG